MEQETLKVIVIVIAYVVTAVAAFLLRMLEGSVVGDQEAVMSSFLRGKFKTHTERW